LKHPSALLFEGVKNTAGNSTRFNHLYTPSIRGITK